MTIAQIQAIGGMVAAAEQVGLEIVGGIKALVRLFHSGASDAELDAAVDAVTADAARRRDERATMTGGAPNA